MDQKKIDLKLLYPNLIVFLGPKKQQTMFKTLSKSFNEFMYGHLFKQKGTSYIKETGQEMSLCRIMQGNDSNTGVCLAEGVGHLPCEAEQQAIERLFDNLRDSFYVIWSDPQYFTKNKVPSCALNPNPSHRHIYRTVYLKKNSTNAVFPLQVSGDLEYVDDYEHLATYIQNHAKNNSRADLFIFNVVLADRPRIRKICESNRLSTSPLVGCSNMGIKAFSILSTSLILQDLLKVGGKNIKYRLIGPRDKYGNNEEVDVKNCFGGKIIAGPASNTDENAEGDQIVINPWIAKHLVIMDYITEANELHPTKEILFRSVRDCPDTEQFIVEKTRNQFGMVLFEGMIDRNVVSREKGFEVYKGKMAAIESAKKNLLKCCNYIQVKKSYLGSKRETPSFLQNPNCTQTKIYRIASKMNGPPNKILQEFKKSWQEDLYFTHEYSGEERKQIQGLAVKMNFLIRWIGKDQYLCVYKKRKPNDIFQELLSTVSKENEKYKLIIPPSIIHKGIETTTTHLSTTNQEMCRKPQANHKPIYNQDPLGSTAETDTQVSGEQTPCGGSDHKSDTQSPGASYSDHDNATQCQGGPAQENEEAPSWAMKFILSSESATQKPKKPSGKPKVKWGVSTNPERKKDDVYNRYKFFKPRPPVVVPTLNSDCQRFQQLIENAKADIVEPDEDPDSKLSLSERLQKALEGARQYEEAFSYVSSKRPHDRESQARETSEPTEKNMRFPAHPQSFQLNSPFERINTNNEGETSNSFSDNRMRLSSGNPRTWGSNDYNSESDRWSNNNGHRYNRSYAEEEYISKDNFSTNVDTQNTFQHRNLYDEDPRFKSEIESDQLFHRRPESSQNRNHQWNSSVRQPYDQRNNTSTRGRNISNLFDYSGPQQASGSQDFSRPLFPPKPPRPWKKNNQFKGHSFSKQAKYGKNRNSNY